MKYLLQSTDTRVTVRRLTSGAWSTAREMSQEAPVDYTGLRGRIVSDYDELSNRLQQVARFALDHPDDIALGTTASISARFTCRHSPSPASRPSSRPSSWRS